MMSLLLTTYGKVLIITGGGSSPWHWASPASTPQQEESTSPLATATWSCFYLVWHNAVWLKMWLLFSVMQHDSTLSWCGAIRSLAASLVKTQKMFLWGQRSKYVVLISNMELLLSGKHIYWEQFEVFTLSNGGLLMSARLYPPSHCCQLFFTVVTVTAPAHTRTQTRSHKQTSQGPTTASAGG